MFVHPYEVDPHISAAIMRNRAYGKETARFLANAVTRAAATLPSVSDVVVLDVGANVGYHTLQLVELGARVFAWECTPVNIRLLRASLALAPNGGRAVLIPRAASNRSGHAVVSTTPASPGASSLGTPGALPWPVDARGLTVETSTALADLRALGVARAHVLKLDVEGHELEALWGLGPLRALGLRALAIEFFPPLLRANGHEPVELLRYVASQGFEIASSGRRIRPAEFDAFSRQVEQTHRHTDLFCRSLPRGAVESRRSAVGRARSGKSTER